MVIIKYIHIHTYYIIYIRYIRDINKFSKLIVISYFQSSVKDIFILNMEKEFTGNHKLLIRYNISVLQYVRFCL